MELFESLALTAGREADKPISQGLFLIVVVILGGLIAFQGGGATADQGIAVQGFTPIGDIDMRSYYSLYDAVRVNGTNASFSDTITQAGNKVHDYSGEINDSNVTDTLTIGSGSTIDKGALDNSGTLGFDWGDGEVSDTLTVGSGGTVDKGSISGGTLGTTWDISDETNLSVSGTLLKLTDNTLNVDEGTLTNTYLCTFVTGSGLVCNTNPTTFEPAQSFGNGIDNTAQTITVAGNTCLTQDADGLSVTADCIGDTQLAFNTGQALTTSSSPLFVGIDLTGNLNISTSAGNSNGGIRLQNFNTAGYGNTIRYYLARPTPGQYIGATVSSENNNDGGKVLVKTANQSQTLITQLQIDDNGVTLDGAKTLRTASGDITLDPAGGDVNVDGNLIPSGSNATHDLGAAPSSYWDNIFVGTGSTWYIGDTQWTHHTSFNGTPSDEIINVEDLTDAGILVSVNGSNVFADGKNIGDVKQFAIDNPSKTETYNIKELQEKSNNYDALIEVLKDEDIVSNLDSKIAAKKQIIAPK